MCGRPRWCRRRCKFSAPGKSRELVGLARRASAGGDHPGGVAYRNAEGRAVGAAMRTASTSSPELIRVRLSLEETQAGGLRFKSPKSKAGVRSITLPTVVVDTLRAQRQRLLEQRLRRGLGLGTLTDHDLVFPRWDGAPQSPKRVQRRLEPSWPPSSASHHIPRAAAHAR